LKAFFCPGLSTVAGFSIPQAFSRPGPGFFPQSNNLLGKILFKKHKPPYKIGQKAFGAAFSDHGQCHRKITCLSALPDKPVPGAWM
jgi:hypothetical protein